MSFTSGFDDALFCAADAAHSGAVLLHARRLQPRRLAYDFLAEHTAGQHKRVCTVVHLWLCSGADLVCSRSTYFATTIQPTNRLLCAVQIGRRTCLELASAHRAPK